MVYVVIYVVMFLNILYPIDEMKITPNKNKAVNNRSPDLINETTCLDDQYHST